MVVLEEERAPLNFEGLFFPVIGSMQFSETDGGVPFTITAQSGET